MKSETFRRTKMLKWIKIQIRITEGLLESRSSVAYTDARSMMIESLCKEFGIGLDELGD